MKWYKAYANLKGHPKRFRLEEKLGIDGVAAIGYIHLFFAHVCEYAQDGDLTNFTPKEIARACEWKGDADVFYTALLDVGFIEKTLHHVIAHDWYEENSRFIKENEKRKTQEKPKGRPRTTRKKPLLQDSTGQDTQDNNTAPPAGPAAGSDNWNPWEVLMRIFKEHSILVTERIDRQIAVVQARGRKVGHEVFESVAKDYCADEFIQKAGRSVNGFLNSFDRILDRRNAKPSKYAGMKPWEIERAKKAEAAEKKAEEHRKKYPCRGSRFLEKHDWVYNEFMPGRNEDFCRNCTVTRPHVAAA